MGVVTSGVVAPDARLGSTSEEPVAFLNSAQFWKWRSQVTTPRWVMRSIGFMSNTANRPDPELLANPEIFRSTEKAEQLKDGPTGRVRSR